MIGPLGRIGHAALGNQGVHPLEEAAQPRAWAGVARIAERPGGGLHPVGQRRIGVRRPVRVHAQSSHRIAPYLASRELPGFDREARLPHVATVGVHEREQERSEVAHVVGVEVGDGEVREGLPPEPLACQAVEGAPDPQSSMSRTSPSSSQCEGDRWRSSGSKVPLPSTVTRMARR